MSHCWPPGRSIAAVARRLLFPLPLFLLLCAQDEVEYPHIKPLVTLAEGDCFVINQGVRIPASGNKIASGDTILTARNGKVQVTFNDSDYIVVNNDSKVRVLFDSSGVEVRVSYGKVYSNAVILPREAGFRVTTDKISTDIKGTAFTIEVDSEQTVINVLEGTVRVTDSDSLCPIDVKTGDRAVLSPGKVPCRVRSLELTELKDIVNWIGVARVKLRALSDLAANVTFLRKLKAVEALPKELDLNLAIIDVADLKAPSREPDLSTEQPELPPEPAALASTYRPSVSAPKVSQLRRRMADLDTLRDPQSIEEAVGANLRQLEALYQRHLRRSEFSGRVLVRFRILPCGSVADPVVLSSSTQNAEFDRELTRLVASIGFSPVLNAREMTIVYPFEFNPEK